MKVLVIGAGGREHALTWALHRSPRVHEMVCAPGNPGIATLARCLPLDVSSAAAIQSLALAEQPDLVVIGPEAPLAAGVVDALQAQGIRVFGPSRAAAQLESSKAFAKRFMRRWNIPTAHYAVCEAAHRQWDDTADLVRGALEKFPQRVVVKADGLAAGKGVVLCDDHEQAVLAAQQMFSGALLGTAVDHLVLEELLDGSEISFFAVCDGERAATLGFAQDHKRIGEGDTGPNTGGMGAYSTDQLVTPELAAWLLENVAQRVVDGMKAEGMPFRGILFTGLMMTEAGPRVLEFNTRFGDPETEALMLRLETDLLDILEASVDGTIATLETSLHPGAAACVVAASQGYPGSYQGGQPIAGLDAPPPGVVIFHAGTAVGQQGVITAGGRVLALASAGATLPQALSSVYSAFDTVHFEGMVYRRDIGWRALQQS